MRIVLVGAPGTGKDVFSNDLHQALKDKGFVLPIAGSSNDYMAHYGKAVGALADYRIELSLAVRRAISMQDLENAIFEGSLLDSVAYSAARYKRLIDEDLVDDQVGYTWWLTMSLITSMLRDTFRADHVIYIKPANANEFKADINEALLAVMKELKIEYREVYEDQLQDEESSAKLVEELIKEFDAG
jgi:hypothetical protein